MGKFQKLGTRAAMERNTARVLLSAEQRFFKYSSDVIFSLTLTMKVKVKQQGVASPLVYEWNEHCFAIRNTSFQISEYCLPF